MRATDVEDPTDAQGTRDPRSGVPVGGWTAVLTTFAVVLVVVLAVAAQRPPAPRGADAPPTAFSAARALDDLTAIAAEPRPIGSTAHRAARDHLLAALEALGLATEVQRTTAVGNRVPAAALVENVLGRLPGTASTGAILLVAHYDTVPTAPGAADDGAAVVAVLETLRALRAGPPLANDVLVLFSDAEEVGLLGAEAFAAEHPWMDEVALVVNLEARGTSGPSVLVETQAGNGDLIRTFARVDPAPAASSLTSALYELLPNDTDYSVFKARGLPGYNFAFIRDASDYHTRLDDLGRVDLASLQHHGEHLLALGRAYGDADLGTLPPAADVVYFDVARRALVGYPASYALSLALLILVFTAVVIGRAHARGLVRARGVAAGATWLVVTAMGAGGVAALVFAGLGRLEPAYRVMQQGAVYHASITVLAFVLLTACLVALASLVTRRRLHTFERALGAYALWAVAGVVVAVALPGGSHLFAWPTLGATLALALVLARLRAPEARLHGGHVAILVLGALPALVLWPAFLVEALAGLGLGLVGVEMVVVALSLGLLAPLWPAMLGRRPFLTTVVLLLASLATFAVGVRLAGFDAERPRPTHAFYVVDPTLAQARFVSIGAEVDAWTSRFFDGAAVGSVRDLLPDAPDLLHATAPVVDLPAPRIELVDDRIEGAQRQVTLRLASARDATQLMLLVHPQTPVDEVTIDGRLAPRLPRPSGWTRLEVHGRMREGVTVGLRTRANAPIALVLIDRTNDLLTQPGLDVPAREADLMAAPSFTSDAVLVRTSWALAPAVVGEAVPPR